MRFVIFPRRTLRGRRWFFRAVARNGESILQSEGYRNLADARETVALIRSESAAARVDIEGD